MDNFRDKYKVDLNATKEIMDDDTKVYTGEEQFNPNLTAKDIAVEELKEFAELVRGTENENLIAFRNKKIQELTDYIMSAIIIENEKINGPDAFPLQIFRRYKSINSLKDKIDNWSKREDRKGKQISDFLGFKIIPESEPPIFYSDGDPILRQMIDQKEKIRTFVAKTYRDIEKNPTMTYAQYCRKTIKVLYKLIDIFPAEASTRIHYYEELIEKIKQGMTSYNELFEDSNLPMHFRHISSIADVDMIHLISELTKNYHSEVVLYKLRRDLLNIFENSEILKNLRSISFRFIT